MGQNEIDEWCPIPDDMIITYYLYVGPCLNAWFTVGSEGSFIYLIWFPS